MNLFFQDILINHCESLTTHEKQVIQTLFDQKNELILKAWQMFQKKKKIFHSYQIFSYELFDLVIEKISNIKFMKLLVKCYIKK